MTANRAALLKETLRLINTYGEFELPDPPDYGPEHDHISSLLHSLRDTLSSRVAKGRTQLSGADEPVSPEAQRSIDASRRVLQSKLWEEKDEIDADSDVVDNLKLDEEDILDRYYSSEVIARLPAIVSRALRLSTIEFDKKTTIPADVERYFSEAHQCYLYGFPVACAVLCRAILEASLKLKIPGKFPDLGDRIEEAHQRGILSQERRIWSYEVKDAGNNAIHQYERFVKGDLSNKVEECLIKTRAIVEELLGADRVAT